MKNITPKICRTCGCSFPGGPRAWYCPACRAERVRIRNAEQKQRKRSGKVIPVGAIIRCELCGKEVIKNGGSQRFCEECGVKHLKEVDNSQSLEWKRKNMDKIRESKRKISQQRHADDESVQSGYPGVCWDKGKRKWRASVSLNRKCTTVINTSDKDIAILAKKEAQSLLEKGELTREMILKIREKYRK